MDYNIAYEVVFRTGMQDVESRCRKVLEVEHGQLINNYLVAWSTVLLTYATEGGVVASDPRPLHSAQPHVISRSTVEATPHCPQTTSAREGPQVGE